MVETLEVSLSFKDNFTVASIRINEPTYNRIVSVCSAGTKKSRTIFAQLILYVIRLRVYLYVSD